MVKEIDTLKAQPAQAGGEIPGTVPAPAAGAPASTNAAPATPAAPAAGAPASTNAAPAAEPAAATAKPNPSNK
jgi:hypothetical protein